MREKPAKILLIEDNPQDARLIWDMLSDDRFGRFTVEVANQPSSGITRLKQGKTDAVLLDITSLNSEELERFFKASQRAGAPPILMLTTSENEKTAVKALHLGAHHYLRKDFLPPNLLKHCLEYAIEHNKSEHKLNERVQELWCLYNIFEIAEKPGLTLDALYQEVLRLLPLSWRYPEMTCAKITIDNKEFRTKNYRQTVWKQSAEIKVNGATTGIVEINCLKERPEADEEPFLEEERRLIQAVARQLGSITERKWMEHKLKDKNAQLEIRNEELKTANERLQREITRYQTAEEEIKRAADEWRTTFDTITDLVSIHDQTGRILRVNRAFAETFDMEPKELIGKACFEVVHNLKKPVANCPHLKTIKTKRPQRNEFYEDRLGIYLEIATAPIFGDNGEVVASVHVSRDITERRQMNEQLMIADRLASIGELASGIAHELNNPLTSVVGFSQLLLSKELPDDVKEDIIIIANEAQRAAGVVKNLLTFARKHGPAKQLLDIQDIINKVIELRAYEDKVNNIRITTRFAPDLPPILGDYFQLQQVFLNIVINAEYFMLETNDKGNLCITTEIVKESVRVSFTDNGPGIPPENLKHLFNPFFTTKEVGKGTGLGLSICHGIITDHQGKIYAKSQPGKGATFIVELLIGKAGERGKK